MISLNYYKRTFNHILMTEDIIPTTRIDNIVFESICNPENKLKIIIIIESESESDKRRKIHQYLEQNHPKIKHFSLYSSLFPADFYATFMKCVYCDFKRVPINDYHYGHMENNQDEYRSGTCPRCDGRNIWEPNYDGWDDIVRLYNHNMIVIGDYVKHTNRPLHAKDAPLEKVEIDLSKNKKFMMKCPDKLIKKEKLQKFIDDELDKNKLGHYTRL